jgi:predicted Rossmann fold nucleotide-binding protein DprA/Smf involved in DNA uptake
MCEPVIDPSRLGRLLGRGFLLSQVIERWQSRAVWVVSRADAEYPSRLKAKLREDAPAIIYGCGDMAVSELGGLAVVGSRHVDDSLVEYTMSVGQLVAHAGRALVSGGAKGIDQAAMRGALDAGGRVCGVLADGLEQASMNREHRKLLLDGRLLLISPYDPSAGFNVGNAMQRNKVIYALADAALVVSSDLKKGGTWTGAVEQLEKLKLVPVYVRSGSDASPGLQALHRKGAICWPDPRDEAALEAVFRDATHWHVPSVPPPSGLFVDQGASAPATPDTKGSIPALGAKPQAPHSPRPHPMSTPVAVDPAVIADSNDEARLAPQQVSASEVLFGTVRDLMPRVLVSSMKDAEIADVLGVSKAQAKVWLKRLVDEGVIRQQRKPAGYVLSKDHLFRKTGLCAKESSSSESAP